MLMMRINMTCRTHPRWETIVMCLCTQKNVYRDSIHRFLLFRSLTRDFVTVLKCEATHRNTAHTMNSECKLEYVANIRRSFHIVMEVIFFPPFFFFFPPPYCHRLLFFHPQKMWSMQQGKSYKKGYRRMQPVKVTRSPFSIRNQTKSCFDVSEGVQNAKTENRIPTLRNGATDLLDDAVANSRCMGTRQTTGGLYVSSNQHTITKTYEIRDDLQGHWR